MVNINKAVFLDRDGVIVKANVRNGKAYAPTKIKDFKIYKFSADCIYKLKKKGFKTIVVTNQPDVGNNIISKNTLKKMHTENIKPINYFLDVESGFIKLNQLIGKTIRNRIHWL